MHFRILAEGFSRPSVLLQALPASPKRKGPLFFLLNPVEGVGRHLGRRHPFIQHFLFTRKSWTHSLGGLPGVLTDAIKSHKNLHERNTIYIHGPPGTHHLFKALKYVLDFENNADLVGVEPFNSREIRQFSIRQNSMSDDDSHPTDRVIRSFEEGDIKIEYFSLESDSVILPSVNQYPAWNNLTVDYKDEMRYPNDIPRNTVTSSFLISDAQSKVLVLDVPNASYLESLAKVIPCVEADVFLDFSSSELRNSDQYRDWLNSALETGTQVFNLSDNKPKATPKDVLNKLKQVYPRNVLHFASDEVDSRVSHKLKDEEEYPNLTFLGTGSKRSTIHRNVSGILLKVSSISCGLLDCGEGTYNRLMEAFGPLGTASVLRNLRFIFISHRHNDHHLGLITILQERDRLFEGKAPKMYLIAPRNFKNLLKHYHGLLEDVLTSVFHINSMRLVKNSNKFLLAHLYTKFLRETDLDSIETLIAEHVKNSYSLNLSAKGWKVLYTGDTKPNPRLENKAPHVLIHEATLPSYLGHIAHTRLHSTTQDAVDALSLSKAQFLILTHFSEVHEVLPHPESILMNDNIGIAFDFITVNPRTIGDIGLSAERFSQLMRVFQKEVLNLTDKKIKWMNIKKLESPQKLV